MKKRLAERKALLIDPIRQKCFCVTFAESNKGENMAEKGKAEEYVPPPLVSFFCSLVYSGTQMSAPAKKIQ